MFPFPDFTLGVLNVSVSQLSVHPPCLWRFGVLLNVQDETEA